MSLLSFDDEDDPSNDPPDPWTGIVNPDWENGPVFTDDQLAAMRNSPEMAALGSDLIQPPNSLEGTGLMPDPNFDFGTWNRAMSMSSPFLSVDPSAPFPSASPIAAAYMPTNTAVGDAPSLPDGSAPDAGMAAADSAVPQTGDDSDPQSPDDADEPPDADGSDDDDTSNDEDAGGDTLPETPQTVVAANGPVPQLPGGTGRQPNPFDRSQDIYDQMQSQLPAEIQNITLPQLPDTATSAGSNNPYQQLLGLFKHGEGANYQSVYKLAKGETDLNPSQDNFDPSKHTIAEVLQYQSDHPYYDQTHPALQHRAMGAYQFKPDTLKGLSDELHLDRNKTVMDSNTQDALAIQNIKDQQKRPGGNTKEGFMANLRSQWDGLNHGRVSPDDFSAAVDALKP